jgi:hypothetical protein
VMGVSHSLAVAFSSLWLVVVVVLSSTLSCVHLPLSSYHPLSSPSSSYGCSILTIFPPLRSSRTHPGARRPARSGDVQHGPPPAPRAQHGPFRVRVPEGCRADLQPSVEEADRVTVCCSAHVMLLCSLPSFVLHFGSHHPLSFFLFPFLSLSRPFLLFSFLSPSSSCLFIFHHSVPSFHSIIPPSYLPDMYSNSNTLTCSYPLADGPP